MEIQSIVPNIRYEKVTYFHNIILLFLSEFLIFPVLVFGKQRVETAAGLITQSAHPDANIIWGTAFDENLSDEMRVTVVATGFDNKSASDLRSSISNAMGGAQSTPSAVFSSETASPAASAAGGAAPAPTAAKPVEEDNSDNGYYDQLMAMLNKRR